MGYDTDRSGRLHLDDRSMTGRCNEKRREENEQGNLSHHCDTQPALFYFTSS